MPTIKKFGTCAIVIRSREHNPPHFHIIYRDGRECVVIISTFEIRTIDKVSASEVSTAIEWATANKDFLMKSWKEITKK